MGSVCGNECNAGDGAGGQRHSTVSARRGAAGSDGPHQHHDPAKLEAHQIEMLTKHLNLTLDQVTQVETIDDSQMVAVRDDTTIARPDKRAKMMTIRDDSQTKIRSVLTV